MQHFELIVLGSGPAGRRAAVQAAKLERSVMVVESRQKVGGVSVHTGTLPSKTLRETVLHLTGLRERTFYGPMHLNKIQITATDLKARIAKTLEHEIEILEHQLSRNRIPIIFGTARFLDPHRISVLDRAGLEQTFSADKFIIAVGSKPHRPSSIPFDDSVVVDSDSIFKCQKIPKSLTVVGAGVIGIEYATIFSKLDVKVTIIEPRMDYLEFIDREIVEEFTHHLHDSGIRFILGATVKNVFMDETYCPVSLLDDGRAVRSEMLLFTGGRYGATDGLNLERCGITPDHRGRVSVDPQTFQTAVPHIYAAGDVIGFPSLASTSMEQGRLAAYHALLSQKTPTSRNLPFGIYSVPEISSVGATEQDLKSRKVPFECGLAKFCETSRGQIMGLKLGTLKLIFSIPDRKLLGVHILGEGASELIHIGQTVLNFNGTIDYFLENTFNYPTLAEAYKVAALDANNRISIPSVIKRKLAVSQV